MKNLWYRISHPNQVARLLSDPVNDLTRLANRYGSDKGDIHFSRHEYTRVYEPLFSPYRECSIRMLEIGLLHKSDQGWSLPEKRDHGGQAASRAPSLRMWSEYFQNGQIFGFDINDFADVEIDRVRTVQGDMGNPQDLARLIETVGGSFDIVIDDASHASHHQQLAFAHLFRHVKPGGLYIIEDLRYQPPDLEMAGAMKTLQLLRRAAVIGDFTSDFISQEASDYLANWTDWIEFFDSTALDDALARNDSVAVVRKRNE